MAIQVRRGNYEDFDPFKMKAGEWACVLNNARAYLCFAPGNTKRIATYEDFEADMILVEQSVKDASSAADNARASAKSAGTDADVAQECRNYVEGAVNAIPPLMSIDFETGELLADGGLLLLEINDITGNLEYNMAGGY